MKFKTAIIGGTFDALHKGHKEYIKLAFNVSDNVFILLTSDNYAQSYKSYNVKSYSIRMHQIRNFIKEQNFESIYHIFCQESLEYVMNFCKTTDISLAIVSPEYYTLFETINKNRENDNYKPFLILIFPLISKNGIELNSTHINQGAKNDH